MKENNKNVTGNPATENENPAANTPSIDVPELKAQLRAELLAEMKLEREAEAKPAEKETKQKVNPYLEELVEITLFKDNDKYKDDVFVSINDEPPLAIKRGVPVKVKRKYKLLLEQSMSQDLYAIQYQEKAFAEMQKKFSEVDGI